MTEPTPQPGADPGVPARNPVSGLTDDGPRTSDTLLTMEGRLAAWAAWFGLEPCPIKRGRGLHAKTIVLNDALLEWMVASGGSLDWFVTGDLRGMAAALRAVLDTLREKNEPPREMRSAEFQAGRELVEVAQPRP